MCIENGDIENVRLSIIEAYYDLQIYDEIKYTYVYLTLFAV